MGETRRVKTGLGNGVDKSR